MRRFVATISPRCKAAADSPTLAFIGSNRETYESPLTVAFYRLQGSLQRSEAAVLGLLRDELPRAAMLDIGVGGGRTTPHFAPLVHSYIGVDLSERMIRACRRRFPRERFEIADVRTLPFADSSFDFVLFSFNGLDYVPSEDRMRALREIRRVGRTGGRFCFSAHNLVWLSRKTPRAWLVRCLNGPDLLRRDEAVLQDGALLFGLATYYVRPEAQVEQLRQTGFREVQIFGEGPYLHYLCRMK